MLTSAAAADFAATIGPFPACEFVFHIKILLMGAISRSVISAYAMRSALVAIALRRVAYVVA
tara:strand:+ start:42768 stop:42953 length:186 start_codon:yes stop_codon:yes gene_type:complete